MDIQDRLRGLLLRHGPSLVVGEFIKKQRDHLDLSSILEETFRRIDLGPRETVCRQGAYVSPEVEFLLRQGAFFHPERRNILLEDTYRYIELGPLKFKRQAGSCFSPEVNFLLAQGTFFEDVPCGFSRLVEATTEYLQQSDHRDNFLSQQARHNIYHPGWDNFLRKVYESLLKSVDSETLCHIVQHISRQQKQIKIYTTPFKNYGMQWPVATYKVNNNDLLINASIAELRGRSDKVTIRVRGRKMKALGPLLQARSPYFKKLINDKSEKRSLKIKGSYKTIQFVVLYAHSELDRVEREFGFEPCDSRDTTEKTLDELVNILHAASEFEMADLFGAVEQHIVKHGVSFIYSKNAQEMKVIANEVNAVFLERYCHAFIATNLQTFTLFPSLPVELRMNIWRQMASQPRLVATPWLGQASKETPPHIARILRVCRESNAEIQQFWGRPSLDGINFKFDIIWLDADNLSLSVSSKDARYCMTHAPSPESEWEHKISPIINHYSRLKVLYLTTKILSDSDEFDYCRRFTNRLPTTLAEARNWIEESAHQRLQKKLPDGGILPRIMLIDETEISRLAELSFHPSRDKLPKCFSDNTLLWREDKGARSITDRQIDYQNVSPRPTCSYPSDILPITQVPQASAVDEHAEIGELLRHCESPFADAVPSKRILNFGRKELLNPTALNLAGLDRSMHFANVLLKCLGQETSEHFGSAYIYEPGAPLKSITIIMATRQRVGVVLTSPKDWDEWLETIKTASTKAGVWGYINPSQLDPTILRPTPEFVRGVTQAGSGVAPQTASRVSTRATATARSVDDQPQGTPITYGSLTDNQKEELEIYNQTSNMKGRCGKNRRHFKAAYKRLSRGSSYPTQVQYSVEMLIKLKARFAPTSIARME
ncbi:hypothetical protein V500_04259 [Pseudogymnoascus sp. VKM F-4518 (FW-2643)]|nr:hypothetical protein V500_04259 [Pseudogymnoascus sp. VKM F-4518 (FW-2643)]